MANFDAFLFEGHGYSEKTGEFDPGATNGSITENALVDAIVKSAKKYLDATGKVIHYDENNFTDKDLAGNTYKYKCGMEVHINSAPGASGVEIFVPCREKHIGSDVEIVKKISNKLNIPNRGVKSRDYNTGNTFNRTNGQALNYTDYYGSIRDAWNRGISLSILEVGFIQNDLSKIQANIDVIGKYVAEYIAGCCDATIKVQEPSKPTSPNTSSGETYFRVICGSYKDRSNAEAQQAKLKKAGFDSFLEAFKK